MVGLPPHIKNKGKGFASNLRYISINKEIITKSWDHHVSCVDTIGVKGVEIDTILNKITVLGYMNRKDVVKAVRRTGRRAEAWPSTCGVEAPSPRLPRGFRCIIPRCIVSKS
ncbi:putative copper ion binding protein [Tripterygium wilfordii]|uniref:Putative copper ion binding protein n=1 Tax=Tripterygium wilfordii TaxID=458696 RepID=A0A7J7BWH1_TRIWF|nr:putative copper ion binding protein [Tripterygium wilfordii]